MFDFLSRLSWLFFNVGVPILAPIALLPLLGFSRFYRRASKGVAIRSVQDGQLLWVVISMCASACYEIGGALGNASSDGARALMFAGLLWHGMFIVTSSMIVSFGTADSMPHPAGENSERVPGRLLMRASLIITTLVAASYSISHYSLT
ncbi:hypothetical protein [Paraburkholderia bryophila]|uniref:Uncharacterized protein n=1 Tax=Paraburkholderia bryophila TaxID=420952 RepID=A0A7Y9WDC5_9BURK|nr:hypothetical protein [Paraburkholderia bryophila]NYH18148.1 hypothetical protein [Paraburkholderia bryophila]NYH22752.1 hypothetical protein [Paraburkholderia bryophila]